MKRTLIAVCTLFHAVAGFGQTPPKFEAASIKISASPGTGLHWRSTPGALSIGNYTLRGLIQQAYDVKDYQVLGGPKWMDSDRYDIAAKAAGPADGVALRAMLQPLLAERFQLVFHRDSKPFPVFALMAAKGGLKIQPVKSTGDSGVDSDGGPITFKEASMARLAQWLTRRLNVPVLDETGVPGVFNFILNWTPDDRSPAAPAAASAVPVPSDPSPSLLLALQEQLGIRIEPRKVPMDVIVVDSAQKATAN
jgi:uncharacterized protein (TIGR03435 family)